VFQGERKICDSTSNLGSFFNVGKRMAIGGYIHFHAFGAHIPTARWAAYFSFF